MYVIFENQFHIPSKTIWNLTLNIKISTIRLSLDCSHYFLSMFVTTAQLHLTNPELQFCVDSNPAHHMLGFAIVVVSILALDNGPSLEEGLNPFVSQSFCKKN